MKLDETFLNDMQMIISSGLLDPMMYTFIHFSGSLPQTQLLFTLTKLVASFLYESNIFELKHIPKQPANKIVLIHFKVTNLEVLASII